VADDLRAWAETLTRGLAVITSPARLLTPPPTPSTNGDAISPRETAQLLLQVRSALKINDLVYGAAGQAARDLVARVASQQVADDLQEGVEQVLVALNKALAVAVEQLTSDELHRLGLLRSADFGDGLAILDLRPLNVLTVDLQGTDARIVVARLDALPPAHPARRLLPPDEHYLSSWAGVAGECATLALGYVTPSPLVTLPQFDRPVPLLRGGPQPFYLIEGSVIPLTRFLRKFQREQEIARREREARELKEEQERQERHELRLIRAGWSTREVREMKRKIADLEKAVKTKVDEPAPVGEAGEPGG
jgi:hypothetical protein